MAAHSQGIGVYFFNVKIPRKTAYFEEKLIRLCGYNFFQNLVVSRNLKINADALTLSGALLKIT
jgi:hypothetical protein